VKRFFVVGAVLGVAGLFACSSKGSETIVNHTGATIDMKLEGFWIRRARTVHIPNGGHRTYERVALPDGVLKLSAGRCEYSYDPPAPGREYWPDAPHGDAWVSYQIEPDFRAYLLPYGSENPMAKAELARIQKEGYPSPPISKTCR
jgi:hypothetical protein